MLRLGGEFENDLHFLGYGINSTEPGWKNIRLD